MSNKEAERLEAERLVVEEARTQYSLGDKELEIIQQLDEME